MRTSTSLEYLLTFTLTFPAIPPELPATTALRFRAVGRPNRASTEIIVRSPFSASLLTLAFLRRRVPLLVRTAAFLGNYDRCYFWLWLWLWRHVFSRLLTSLHTLFDLHVELLAWRAVSWHTPLLAPRHEIVFDAGALTVLVVPLHELRAGDWSAPQPFLGPLLVGVAVNQRAPVILGVQEVVVDAHALALSSVPLLVPVAVSDVVRILDAAV